MVIDKREFINSLETDEDFRRSVVAALMQDVDAAEKLSEVSLQGTLQELTTAVRRLNGTVGNLSGAEFEWESNRRLPFRLEEALGIRELRMLRSRGILSADGQRLTQTVSRSELSPEQRQRIGDTDMIAVGEAVETGERVYIGVELSTTVKLIDITRARDTAAYLRIVYQGDTRAVVAGYAIRDEDQRRADDHGVEVILLEYD